MSLTQHPGLATERDSGNVYAYAYGALRSLSELLFQGTIKAETFYHRARELSAAVEERMTQLDELATARVEALELARGASERERRATASCAIYAASGDDDAETDTPDPVIEP